MKSLVRLCLVSVVLAALAFFCDGLRVNFLSSPQDKAYIGGFCRCFLRNYFRSGKF